MHRINSFESPYNIHKHVGNHTKSPETLTKAALLWDDLNEDHVQDQLNHAIPFQRN